MARVSWQSSFVFDELLQKNLADILPVVDTEVVLAKYRDNCIWSGFCHSASRTCASRKSIRQKIVSGLNVCSEFFLVVFVREHAGGLRAEFFVVFVREISYFSWENISDGF